MSTDDQNVFQPSRADCERLAKAMGNGVTSNALRQRIAKLRNKNPISSGGATTTTPASTAKKGGGSKKKRNAVSKLDYGEDSDYGATPSKKGRARGGGGGGARRGRKRSRSDDNDDDGDDDGDDGAESNAEELKSGASARAAKKAKTMGKNVNKQEQVPEVEEEEEELKIEHEELAGDAGDVGVVAANTIMGGMAFGALDDGEAEPLLGQGSFFYLQDEDEEVV